MMRIRVSAELGGVLMVIGAGLIVAAVIVGILNFVKDTLFKNNEKPRKVLSIISTLVWILAVALIILDLTNIFPLIRSILFILLGE